MPNLNLRKNEYIQMITDVMNNSLLLFKATDYESLYKTALMINVIGKEFVNAIDIYDFDMNELKSIVKKRRKAKANIEKCYKLLECSIEENRKKRQNSKTKDVKLKNINYRIRSKNLIKSLIKIVNLAKEKFYENVNLFKIVLELEKSVSNYIIVEKKFEIIDKKRKQSLKDKIDLQKHCNRILKMLITDIDCVYGSESIDILKQLGFIFKNTKHINGKDFDKCLQNNLKAS